MDVMAIRGTAGISQRPPVTAELRKSGPVEAAVTRLEEDLLQLRETLSGLERKLDPIMSPPSPEAPTSPGRDDAGASQIHNRVASAAQAVREMARGLAIITSRVEL